MLGRGVLAAIAVFVALGSSTNGQSIATVRNQGARLVKSPDSNALVVKALSAGQELEVKDLFLDRDWTKVSVNGEEGWVRRKRIKVKMDDPWKSAAWLMIGRTPKSNGFTVRLYLNTTQIIRYENSVRFWTRMVPDNKKAYFAVVMDRPPSKKPSDFRYSSELWEGDCRTGDLALVRSLLYWKSSGVTRPNIAHDDVEARKNTAARVILEEACKAAKR